MNKVTAEARQRDSAVILFDPGDYCALTIKPHLTSFLKRTKICPAKGIDRIKKYDILEL